MDVSKCKYCKKEIEPGAKKCDRCGSNQTFSGRFIHAWIPLLSFMFVCFSWVQTYSEYQAKKDAQDRAAMAQRMAVKAEDEKVSAIIEKEEAQQTVVLYDETIKQIEREVQQLKRINIQSPDYQRRLNLIDRNIEKTRVPTKKIDGVMYRRVE